MSDELHLKTMSFTCTESDFKSFHAAAKKSYPKLPKPFSRWAREALREAAEDA